CRDLWSVRSWLVLRDGPALFGAYAEPDITGNIYLDRLAAFGTCYLQPEWLPHNTLYQRCHHRVNIVEALVEHVQLFSHLLKLMPVDATIR
ncbi:MAG: hypothetical protein N3E40_05050, partial [Dehalococcoidia bacterium]|nr:hypothetical protein [Dehalococcoidia bacterium]